MTTSRQSGSLFGGMVGAKRSTEVTVERSRFIAASPEKVFVTLSDPQSLPRLLPRVNRVEMGQRDADSAQITTYMSLGPLGTTRTEGTVRWRTDQEITFVANKPLPLEVRWTLIPSGSGTDLHVVLSLDLSPMLGPLAAFVPRDNVTSMIGPDLDATLATVAQIVESSK